MSDQDDVTLVLGGQVWGGWTDVRITRRLEGCPNDFTVSLTDRLSNDDPGFIIQPGDSCQVKIGADLVITAYVDRVNPSIDPDSHTITISGRGKCQDLVDCSVQWEGCQISGANVVDIAKKLAAPFGIAVEYDGNGANAPIPQFNVLVTETPYDVIERICRWESLLAYETPEGNLRLGIAGKEFAANGFRQGDNVINASLMWATDQRYSKYSAFLMSVDTLSDVGNGGNLLGVAEDTGIKRFRPRSIVAEAAGGGMEIAKQRAAWDCARRFARSAVVMVTTDSWRDNAGALYTPNTLAHLDLPAVMVADKNWLIGEVTYRRGTGGTLCDLTIMPAEGFLPEPILLQPVIPDIVLNPS